MSEKGKVEPFANEPNKKENAISFLLIKYTLSFSLLSSIITPFYPIFEKSFISSIQ
jgi:hypothetical protein